MKFIKLMYFRHKLRIANDNIDFSKGLHNATEEQLCNNISVLINQAKRNYYSSLIDIYQSY